MLEIMRLLFKAIFDILNYPMAISENITIRIWVFWAFALVTGLLLKFAFGGSKDVD